MFLDETDGKILVECRRHTTSKIDQGQVAEVLGRIIETNAEGAIIVAPVGYQKGAKLVAKAHKITLATLDADATEREYILEICDLLFRGIEARGGMAVGTSADVGVKYNIFGSGGIVIG